MSDIPQDTQAPQDDDLTALLAKREHARPNRATWVLLTLLLLTAGFVGGALTYRAVGPSTTGSVPDFATAMAADMPGLPGTTDATTGTGGFAGPAGMTAGTVTLVDGSKLYVTTGDGAVVIVTVPDSATVTAQEDISLADLSPGDTVIVRGATGDDGTVTATSVAEGALPAGAPTTTTTTPTTTQTTTQTTTPGEN
jgi:hypothetical protein